MSQIKFKGKNVVELATWLKRFSTINNSLLFEIDTKTQELIGKTYSEDRSLVKMSRISFSDLGFTMETKPIEERVRIGLYNILKMNKILGQFAGSDLELTIKYSPNISDDQEESLAGLNILFTNSLLKVGLECSSLSIFDYLSDEKFTNSIAFLESENVSFDLKKEDKDQIMILSDLDKDFRKMNLRVIDGKVYARSKTFELQLGISKGEKFEFPILKSQFSKLDSENYHIRIGDNRAVLESTDSQTVSVIGILNENDYDSEKELDLN